MVVPEARGSTPQLTDPPISAADLRAVGLFGALPDGILEAFAQKLVAERIPTGVAVFEEGTPANCLYVLLDGEVEVMKKSHAGRDHRVALLGPTDCFGEMSLIDVQPRSATVRTIAPCRVLRITSEDFDRLYRQDLKSYALVVLNIARDLSRRLRVADGILADVAGSIVDRYAKPRAK
jgi:CRP-like cAMP-binding protein